MRSIILTGKSSQRIKSIPGKLPGLSTIILRQDPVSGIRPVEAVVAQMKTDLTAKEKVLFDCLPLSKLYKGETGHVRRLLKYGTIDSTWRNPIPGLSTIILRQDPVSGIRPVEAVVAQMKTDLTAKEKVLFDCCIKGETGHVRRLLKYGTIDSTWRNPITGLSVRR